MRRRTFLQALAALRSRPNVVLILAEDLVAAGLAEAQAAAIKLRA